jgi:hypothetical protein
MPMSRWQYFDPAVDKMMACPCCGKFQTDDGFMHKLVQVRIMCGFPFRVNSLYRCPNHNSSVSSTGFRGPHTTGRAIDIAAPTSAMRLAILEAAHTHGFRRFGIARTFIHIDDLTTEDGFPEGIWSY